MYIWPEREAEDVGTGYIARLKQEKRDQEREAQHLEHYSGYNGGFGPQRGGHVRGRASSVGYHPYGRPYAALPFKHNTMMFKKQETTTVTSEVQEAPTLTASSDHLRPADQQQLRPKRLCSAFTMTGTRIGNTYLSIWIILTHG